MRCARCPRAHHLLRNGQIVADDTILEESEALYSAQGGNGGSNGAIEKAARSLRVLDRLYTGFCDADGVWTMRPGNPAESSAIRCRWHAAIFVDDRWLMSNRRVSGIAQSMGGPGKRIELRPKTAPPSALEAPNRYRCIRNRCRPAPAQTVQRNRQIVGSWIDSDGCVWAARGGVVGGMEIDR